MREPECGSGLSLQLWLTKHCRLLTDVALRLGVPPVGLSLGQPDEGQLDVEVGQRDVLVLATHSSEENENAFTKFCWL